MSRALPYSDIDSFFNEKNSTTGCIADTSFLISISDKENRFHEDAQFLFDKLADYQVPIYVTVTARSEFIDYHRRVIITETLMDMLAPSSKWKISAAVREVLKSQRGWLDNQARKGDDPYLSDYRIKECKQAFLPRTQSGQIGWVKICEEYLANRLLLEWEKIAEKLSLNYMDMKHDDSKPLLRKELIWENMYRLSEQSALGSNDAMILNLADSSIFPLLVTSDYDLA